MVRIFRSPPYCGVVWGEVEVGVVVGVVVEVGEDGSGVVVGVSWVVQAKMNKETIMHRDRLKYTNFCI
jgi:hypothetical protein